MSSESWGDYTVNIHRHGDDIFEACEVLRGGKHLYMHVEHRIKIGNIGLWNSSDPKLAMGRDITGDGKPNLVISSHSGGVCGMSYYHFFELSPSFRLLDAVGIQHCTADLEDLDGNGCLELVTADATFHYWHEDHARSPTPRVILRFDNGKLRLAEDLMRKPAPPAEEISRGARAMHSREQWAYHATTRPVYTFSGAAQRLWFERWKRVRVPTDLWREMLDLIYSGNEKTAIEFMEKAWKPGYPGKAQWLAEFRAKLSQSPFWPEIEAMNRSTLSK